MEAVERVFDKIAPSDQVEAEQAARALASVSRSLREIQTLTARRRGRKRSPAQPT